MKKLTKKSAALLVAGLLTCSLLAGCGGGDKKDAPKDGKAAVAKTLTFGCQMYSDGLINPASQVNCAWNVSRFGIGQTLFRFDDNVKAIPQLAESATPSDGNKTWTFKLKKGIKFSNGTEMTATKVKESLDWIREAGKKGSSNPTKFLDAGAVVTADDAAGTIVIKSEKAYPDMPASLADPAMCIIDVKGTKNFDSGIIGTGPYMVKTFKDHVGYEMVANPHYWNGKPPYEEVKIMFMGDASAKANALRAGQIDIAENIMNVADLKALQADKKFTVQIAPGTRVAFSWMNMREGHPLANKALRQAVLKAIDYKTICKSNTIGGLYTPGPSVIPSSLGYGFDKLKNPYEYDPEGAKKILDEAGIKDTNGDGIREKDGQKLVIRWLTYPSRQELPLLAESSQAFLKQIGIEVDINCTANRRQFLADMSSWDIYASALVTAPSGDPQYFFTTSCLPGMSYNFGPYENEHVNDLLHQLSTEFDTARRAELAIELQQTILDDSGYVFCSFLEMSMISKANVHNWTAHACDYYEVTVDLDID